MEDFVPPAANARPLPAADVKANDASANVEYEAYPVRKPEEDLNDFKVQVRATTLDRCRTKLSEVSTARFPWHEVMLALSTLAGGTSLGSLSADIKAGTLKAGFFYTFLPVIAVAAFVAYLFLRRSAVSDPAKAASDVLTDLPDPNKTR
jgi:hypothetical protein